MSKFTRPVLGILILLYVLPAGAQNPIKTLKITDANAKLLDHLEKYPDLEVLSIQCVETLKTLPDSIGELPHLKELNMDNGNGCAMNPQLPESIGNLLSLEKLVLFGAQDPRGVGQKTGPQPTERHKFPSSMSNLKNLVFLDLGRNGLDEIPQFVKDLPKLKELAFGWNMSIKPLPGFLVELRQLATLRLESDGLTTLPDFLNRVPKLNRITLGNNCAISGNSKKKQELIRRFPRITLDFNDEYDCPAD